MIKIAGASVAYGSHTILRDVSLQIHPGELVFVTGQTGSGKTTLLKLLSMELMPTRGTVSVGDFHSSSIKARQKALLRRSLGIVFQDYRLLDDRSVYENVAFALEVTGARRRDIKRKVLMALGQVGLAHQRHRRPRELSGGEQQRVVIARALVNSPVFLLADEPTGNLDPLTAKEILQVLTAINTGGTGVVMATHNAEQVRDLRGRRLLIEGGTLRELPPC
ncbi:MAG TPA: ATP-binding cassette domain-containing protein [Bacteroidota bacterium]